MNVINECPRCGAANQIATSNCEYCGSAFVFRSLSDFATAPDLDFGKALQFFRRQSGQSGLDDEGKFDVRLALGLCFLKQRAFPLALSHFAKMVDEYPDQPKPYVYQALAMLGGKKPRISTLKVIRDIGGILGMAGVVGDGGGQAHALQAVIEYDYYGRNGLKFPDPSPFELIQTARGEGMSLDELLASIELVGLIEEEVEELI